MILLLNLVLGVCLVYHKTTCLSVTGYCSLAVYCYCYCKLVTLVLVFDRSEDGSVVIHNNKKFTLLYCFTVCQSVTLLVCLYVFVCLFLSVYLLIIL